MTKKNLYNDLEYHRDHNFGYIHSYLKHYSSFTLYHPTRDLLDRDIRLQALVDC